MIISGYRYHLQAPEEWEFTKWGTCFGCEERDWPLIFDICNRSCSYLTLLQKLPETRGIIIEALNLRGQLRIMAENLLMWANDPHVLHLSVGHLSMHFDATMRCVNTFLGSYGFSPRELEALNASDQANRRSNHQHITRGKYHNGHLRKTLLATGAWGSFFRWVWLLLGSIFERQRMLYGCPVPHKGLLFGTRR
jgi:hypothetical protein